MGNIFINLSAFI